MPYTAKTAPKAIRALPGHARRIWIASFNSAHKFYNGNESKAHATAWSAVKKKYHKKGETWVANQSALSGEVTMNKLLAELQGFYEACRQSSADPSAVDLTGVQGILNQVAANPSTDGYLLKDLDQHFVAAIGFDLNQHYGIRADHLHDYPGSLQHQIRLVMCALKKDDEQRAYLGDWGSVLAVYPDFVVTCALDDDDDYGDGDYWKIGYTLDENTGDVTFGEAEPVDVATIVVPEGHAPSETYAEEEAEEEGQQNQMEGSDGSGEYGDTKPPKKKTDAPVMKTEGGKQFGKGAYLIIGDAKLPSTWKVRVEEEPGKVTVPQLGRAYAALTKGFRGNKVDASGDAVKGALSKLKGLYKEHGAPFPGESEKKQDSPVVIIQGVNELEWLRQGLEPPGGEEDLTQEFTAALKQEGFDETTGILKVSGVATTADVVNSKNQVYPLQVWEDNLPRLNRLLQAGKLVGESEHPSDGRASLDRTCIKFTKLWMDGNQAKFEAEILPTEPHGKNLQTLIQNGVSVDISSRGKGTTKAGDWNGTPNVAIVQRGFRCDAFDCVVAGASPGSTITGWQVQSLDQTANADTEEEMTKEMQAQFDAKMAALDAKLKELNEKNVTPEPQTQAAATPDPVADQQAKRLEEATAKFEQAIMRGRKADLLQEAAQKWTGPWVNMYQKLLDNCGANTAEELEQASTKAIENINELIGMAPKFPGKGFVNVPGRGEGGPRTINQMLDALVDGLSDERPDDLMNSFRDKDENGNPIIPGHLQTPKRQCRKMLQNMVEYVGPEWDGNKQATGLLRLMQGNRPEEVADFLNQDLNTLNQTISPDGSTAVGAGGAPTSAIFVFPLIRRVFPQLIATEIASVQPMDRPNGKIFYLDAYRVSTGVDSVDEGGATVSNRTRIDISDSFSDSYANDPGETATANLLQMRLSSKDVTAQTKKLYANWSIEEMQDLRAYHGLDASLELVGALSREIALEWNQIVLKELLSGATAGNRNFGTTAPSGYTQKEWDEYITRYIDALSSDVFSHRFGDITHMLAGPSAWVKLSATHRTGTLPNSGPNPEQYAGLTLTPFMAGATPNVKTYKVGFWTGVNTNKVLVLRRGTDWSDTPYVWAPYIDYISPTLTSPDVFTQKQGLMSRAAHLVTVGNAIATLTINSGVSGTAL